MRAAVYPALAALQRAAFLSHPHLSYLVTSAALLVAFVALVLGLED